MKNLIITLVFTFYFFSTLAQTKDTTNMIRFTPDFRFNDGIFLNFTEVKENSPLPKSKILTSIDYNDEDFFNLVLKEKQISFYDEIGSKQTILTKNIWGFSRNGNLYIRQGEEMYRITFVGSICHFIANVKSYSNGPYDPMYNGYNSYNAYSPYYYGSPYSNTIVNKEVKQFILDFETGMIMDFEVKPLEAILARDAKLYDEFSALSSRKQKQLKFLYLRKYNERNPLYFPDKSKLLIK